VREFAYPDVDTRPAALLSQRSDPIDHRTAEYNPFLSSVLGFNVNVQLLSGKPHEAMVQFYLLKYLQSLSPTLQPP